MTNRERERNFVVGLVALLVAAIIAFIITLDKADQNEKAVVAKLSEELRQARADLSKKSQEIDRCQKDNAELQGWGSEARDLLDSATQDLFRWSRTCDSPRLRRQVCATVIRRRRSAPLIQSESKKQLDAFPGGPK